MGQPILAHDVAAKGDGHHGRMPGQHFGRDVVVAVDPVQSLVQARGIARRVTGAMQNEAIVMGRVEPGNAFRVVTPNRPHGPAMAPSGRDVDTQVVRLRSVQPADQLVVAAFRDLRRVVPEQFANPGEGIRPTYRGVEIRSKNWPSSVQ